MRRFSFVALTAAGLLALGGCSLFVSLDGLSDGDAGATDASDASVEAGSGGDASSPREAGNDSGADAGINPCTTSSSGTAGPRMIQANGYCIDSTEVTVAQYMQFVADAGASMGQAPVCAWNVSFAPDTATTNDGRCDVANVDPFIRTNYPITCVNWCDAFAYCAWAGKRLCGAIGGGSVSYGSPDTSSQWFVACASTENDRFPNDSNDGGNCALPNNATVPVDTRGCNGGYAGLSDMIGNAEEWTDSCDTSGETPDGGGTALDQCHELGGEFDGFSNAGCTSTDSDYRSETWGGIGFRCCSK